MDARQAWQATLGQLQMDMPKATYDTWVKETKLLNHADQTFTIGIDNAYVCDWLTNRLTRTAEKLLSGMMDAPQNVKFVIRHNETEPAPSSQTEPDDFPEESEDALPHYIESVFNPRYKFDNFVVGPNNRLAQAASLAVAENPAKAYNPLFLYGGVGLGKTHLLQAIGIEASRRNKNILYVSSEEFTNDLINAIRRHNTTSFRDKYRKIDVLLIDDIQFIAGKESTQEEFFHTFNTLHGQEKQIVMTSDRPPKAMLTLEERLRSRFEWGLIVDIQPPEFETRVAILRFKADQAGRTVNNTILEYIARKIQSNIRELEGALTRVLAFSDLSGKELDIKLAEMALVDFLPLNTAPSHGKILDAVVNAFDISEDELLSRNRSKRVALPRQIAMYLLRECSNESLPNIGKILGGRDHTTVLYGCDKIAEMVESDEMLRRQVLQIREEIFNHQAIA